MKKQLFTILASLMLATTAYAGSFNIGASGGLATVDASGTETTNAGDSGTANTNSTQVDNKMTGIGSIFAEYESDFYGLTLGLEWVPGSADVSDKTHSRTDTETSVTSTLAETSNSREFKVGAEVENYQTAYIEASLVKGMFIRAGLSQIDVNINDVVSGNGGTYGNTSLDGSMVGIGFKGVMANNDNLGWKAYYEKTNFDTLKITQTGNSVADEANSIQADLDVSAVKLALSYRF